ncbi:MAG TPA: PLP-dependent transferase, partial [Sphingomonadaceae bacterium]|nr:PLP-dependent transferase [Sphingomonadaceae bacterium]
TPYLTRPIALGADLVVHSATKYLGGHGDLVAGLVVGRAEAIGEIRLVGMKDMTGAVMAPFNAMLILRGLKTLALRMERHCANAHALASWLQVHPKVAWVSYAALDDDHYHALCKRYLGGKGGAVFTFGLKGGYDAGVKLVNSVELFSLLANIGDTRSLIIHPASTTHSQLSEAELLEAGAGPDVVRVSVGIEHIDDIIADLSQALDKI